MRDLLVPGIERISERAHIMPRTSWSVKFLQGRRYSKESMGRDKIALSNLLSDQIAIRKKPL
jgi:hypothetical protein